MTDARPAGNVLVFIADKLHNVSDDSGGQPKVSTIRRCSAMSDR